MQRYRDATNNLRFNLTYFSFEVKCCFLLADYSGVITKAHEAINYCLTQDDRFHYHQAPYVASLSYALLQTDNYAEGLVYAKKLLSTQDVNTLQYLKTIELIVLLSFRAGDFQQAADYFTLLQKSLRTQQWESYALFSSYLFLLKKAGKIEAADKSLRGSGKKIKEMLVAFNQSHPDSNNGIHLLVVEAFLELYRKRYANFRRVIDQLKLIKQEACSKRASYFISSLEVLPKQAFHQVAVSRHAKKFLGKMSEHQAERPLEEIIPFELLWELFMDLLGLKRISTRKPRAQKTKP
jgi:tetratricopeptide (TPR) repeat protein